MFLPVLALALGTLAASTDGASAADGSVPLTLDLGSLVDRTVPQDDGALLLAARRSPNRRSPVRRTPVGPDRRAANAAPSPLNVGLAGAAGAAIGASVGAIGIGVAGAFATQLAGPQPPEVVIATGILAVGIAVATPFMAGLGGGAGVLLADSRSRPDEWQGLLQCASSGYCAGLAAVAGPILGGGVACAPQSCLNLPGPDRPAEWTAGAAIAGLVAGGLVGVVGGYTLAPDKADPALAIGVGAFSGAILGSAVAGGLAGGVATMTRQ
jgi:MFS family permease